MNTHKSEHELIVRLRHTLDNAAHQPDDFDHTLASLGKKAAATRQQKLQRMIPAHTKGWLMGGLVVAASFSVVVLPNVFTSTAQQASVTASQTLNNLTVASVAPQLLEDIEMVTALGDDNGDQ